MQALLWDDRSMCAASLSWDDRIILSMCVASPSGRIGESLYVLEHRYVCWQGLLIRRESGTCMCAGSPML